jgi:hypothetical protein
MRPGPRVPIATRAIFPHERPNDLNHHFGERR